MTITHDPRILAAWNGLRWRCSQGLITVLLALLGLTAGTTPSATAQCGVGGCDAIVPVDVEYGLGNLWVRGDVLLWWTNRGANPALVTTSPGTTPPEQAGRLDDGSTTVLFGGDDLSQGVAAGGRFTVGWWFHGPGTTGLEASYFVLGGNGSGFQASSPNPSVLARPFFDVQTGLQDALLIAHPQFLAGSIHVDLNSRLQGFGLAWRHSVLQGCWHHTDLLLGYRVLEFDERLRISSDSEFTEPWGQIIPGTTRQMFDQFDLNNRFHGVDLGMVHYHQIGCLTAEASLKVAFGGTTAEADIDGRTINTVPGAGSAEFPGGLFAQGTNIGWYHAGQFAVVPEFGMNLGYDMTPNLRLSVGYQLLVWPRVMRAIDQVDVRMSQLPPEPQAAPNLPQFPATSSTFVVQGLQLGLQLVW
jgi:hypothetical protein